MGVAKNTYHSNRKEVDSIKEKERITLIIHVERKDMCVRKCQMYFSSNNTLKLVDKSKIRLKKATLNEQKYTHTCVQSSNVHWTVMQQVCTQNLSYVIQHNSVHSNDIP